MKSTKKLLALLLSAILLLSLLPAAFATEVQPDTGDGDTHGELTPPTDNNYSLTITNTVNGRQYELYQVFKGTLHTEGDKKILSDVFYGESWKDQTLVGTPVPENILNDYVAGDGKANIDKFLPQKSDNPFREQTAIDDKATFENLLAGYYVVLEVGNVTGHAAKSEYIIQVVGNTSVAAKMDVPTSYKKVEDTNDTTGITTGWQDSADYDIGDNVPFQLTATVAKNILDFKGPYALTFHDKQSPGLTFNPNSVVVKIDGNTVTTGYTVVTEGITDGCTFHVKFDDLKAYNKEGQTSVVTKDSVITVEYTSKLNENAKIGAIGNPNEMHITFSNNPNSTDPEENGETPKDKVIVFTFQLDVYKLDGSSTPAKPMEDAEFTLYKMNHISGKFESYKVITPEQADGSDNEEGIKHIYHFKGLDDGTYQLVETVTPQGYNTADPIKFTITAEHEIISPDPKLTSLSGDNTIILNIGAATSGILSTYVQNFKGNTLPSTGGMGTTVFYVLGSILAVGAAILLVSKKRMNGAR